MIRYIFLASLLILFSSCKKEEPTSNSGSPTSGTGSFNVTNPNLKHFGFSLVDVGFDDPTDSEVKSNYLDEVHAFSNLADILIYAPNQNISSNVNAMLTHDVKPYLHLNELFFEQTGTGGSMSGSIYSLRSDYQQRWNTFLATNPFITSLDSMQCFYIGEEPTWNSISFNDLKLACDLVKQTAPQIPILVIEAYPAIGGLQLPTSVDWYGFDHYFIENPQTSQTFNDELQLIRTKQSDPNQKIVLVLDAHYIPSVHGAYGIQESQMTSIAHQYFQLANQHLDVTGIIGYHWPSGFELSETIGARHLSNVTKTAYSEMGKSISGK